MQVMTIATRDRKRQTETKNHQQNIVERTGIVRNSKVQFMYVVV